MASLCFFFYFMSLSLVPAALGSFSVELIDRDSPKSPLYDPSPTSFDRWRMAAERSYGRARHFAKHGISTSASIVSPVAPSDGGYLMKLSLGSPPFDIYAIPDTGSDLIWTNCIPCKECYHQKEPLFDPAKSTTYSNIPCPSKQCSALSKHVCDDANRCEYEYNYAGGSTITGLLAKDKFTFSTKTGAHISIEATFGCTHKSIGVGGIVGLGGGELSLVSQLGGSINGQFSYCLLPYTMVDKSSKLVLGPDDRAPRKVYKTPLIKNAERSTFYFLNLLKITVGKKSIPIPSASSSSSSGNIIIDSGTTMTILDKSVVDEVVSEVKKVVNLPLVTDPKFSIFSICFDGTNAKDPKLPEISFSFAGATVPLYSQNMFAWVVNNVLCLALGSVDGSGGHQIYGRIAQQNFYVAYDLRQRELSFSPVNCARY